MPEGNGAAGTGGTSSQGTFQKEGQPGLDLGNKNRKLLLLQVAAGAPGKCMSDTRQPALRTP